MCTVLRPVHAWGANEAVLEAVSEFRMCCTSSGYRGRIFSCPSPRLLPLQLEQAHLGCREPELVDVRFGCC